MISGTANGHVPFTQTDCAGWVGEIRMKKRIISVVLSMLMMLGTVPYAVTAAGGGTDEYPELMITQIGVDQYGSRENAANTNPKYNEDAGNNPNADVYEFISVYNNSDRELNVYDYMIGYQGLLRQRARTFLSVRYSVTRRFIPVRTGQMRRLPHTIHTGKSHLSCVP